MKAPTKAELFEMLEAATAYVELFTGNGVQKQPPARYIKSNGDFDAEAIARDARALLARVPGGEVPRRWHVGRVVRSNAGGALYNAVDQRGVESEHIPTHDYKAAQALVDKLNGVQP